MATRPSPLPLQVQKQVATAKLDQQKLERNAFANPKKGRPKAPRPQQQIAIYSESEQQQDLDTKQKALAAAIGPRHRGNKRVGQIALFADLIDYFYKLNAQGVALPKFHLSKAAATADLERILIRHGHLPTSSSDPFLNSTDLIALSKSETRKQIGNKLARIFRRVAESVENYPLQ